MEEGRWAARLLSEIGSARAAIAASYLSLWKTGGGLPDSDQGKQDPVPGLQHDEPPARQTATADEIERT